MIAQVGVVTVAAAAGAALAQRHLGRQEARLGTAVGALLVIVGLHLLPEARNDAGGRSSQVSTTLLWAVGRIRERQPRGTGQALRGAGRQEGGKRVRTVGVEEELLLVDPDSGDPKALPAAVLAHAAQDDPGQDFLEKELFGHSRALHRTHLPGTAVGAARCPGHRPPLTHRSRLRPWWSTRRACTAVGP
ncbi:hypothetical protein GCM10022207_71380 [Streptomyces lannensis]|uniref:Integral membrane protein n=1 Tax=Streptomyces lannensis TaxID=766498 RepID=A0ABP7L4U6_9ACTN